MSSTQAHEFKKNSSPSFNIDFIEVDGVKIRYAIREGSHQHTPLFLFNGIGANIELTKPFVDAMPDFEIITCDMPGVGDSTDLCVPKRFPGLAKLTSKILDALGYPVVDVAGVSWGGALAQQFAKSYPNRCRRLILAATSMGAVMLPGKPSVIMKMVTPRRYLSKDYLAEVAPFIYGGKIRHKPHLVHHHAKKTKDPSFLGYLYQMMAGLGWTSVHWLHKLPHKTLIIAGDDDPIIPLVNAKVMASLINHSELYVVEGGGHLFLVMRANEVVPKIKAFLTRPDD